jgi:hypothetical protein
MTRAGGGNMSSVSLRKRVLDDSIARERNLSDLYRDRGAVGDRAWRQSWRKEDDARRHGQEEVMAKAAPQKSLDKWTKQKWRTKSGKPSTQGPKATGERYLPEKAIKALSPSEYAATTKAKREGTRKGKQFVKQPKNIAKKTAAHRKAK